MVLRVYFFLNFGNLSKGFADFFWENFRKVQVVFMVSNLHAVWGFGGAGGCGSSMDQDA